jgi:hypothetical protein
MPVVVQTRKYDTEFYRAMSGALDGRAREMWSEPEFKGFD